MTNMQICLAVLLACAAFTAAQDDKPVPNEEWGRAPLPPKSDDSWSPNPEQVMVSYESSDPTTQVMGAKDPMHVRAKDQKVVIHPDSDSSYNAGGSYLKDVKDDAKACCNICPRNKDCDKHGVEGCYSKCHKICGPQCIVPTVDPDSGDAPSTCVIGVDCGMSGSSSTPGITAQDMNPDWKNMKAGKSENTPDKPNAKWARPPLAGQGATGPAPENIPVPSDEVKEADVVAPTGAASPDALGQPLPEGVAGPSTPTEQQAQAAAKMKEMCNAPAEAGCAAMKGCSWCAHTTKCITMTLPCGAAAPTAATQAAFLQTGARYTRAFRSGN